MLASILDNSLTLLELNTLCLKMLLIYSELFFLVSNGPQAGMIMLLIEKCVHDIEVTTIQWIKPPDQWMKLNSDSSALQISGKMGIRGIITNKERDLLLAFVVPLLVKEQITRLRLRLLCMVLFGIFGWGITKFFQRWIQSCCLNGLFIKSVFLGILFKLWPNFISTIHICKISTVNMLLERPTMWLIL